MSDDRFDLPDPPRRGPYRDFSNVLRSAGPEGDPDECRADETSEAAGSFVAEGVRSAYQVVDAYMRQGQRVARSLGLPTYQPPLPGGHLDELSARWIHASSELMAIGFEFLGSLAESMAAASQPYPSRRWGGPGIATGPGPGVRVHFEITSTRPAQPKLEFLPGHQTLALASHGLRAREAGDDMSIPVEFEAAEHERCVLVRIRVPSDQPPGLYTGVLLHALSGESVGSLSLLLR